MDAEGNPVVNIRRILKGFTLFNVDQCDRLPIETIKGPSCSRSQLVESSAYQAVDALLASHSVKFDSEGITRSMTPTTILLVCQKKQRMTQARNTTTALSCTN